MINLRELHNPSYDPLIKEAHDFTSKNLGLSPVPLGNVAVVGAENRAELIEELNLEDRALGMYFSDSDVALLMPPEGKAEKTIVEIALGATAVHEMCHSALMNSGEHNFFNEALAGMAEIEYLKKLEAEGRRHPKKGLAIWMRLHGVELTMPTAYFYDDNIDNLTAKRSEDGWFPISEGIIAAHGFSYCLAGSGVEPVDILRYSQRESVWQFAAMRSSLDSIQAGLAQEIESLPSTYLGSVQASSLIKETAARSTHGKTKPNLVILS